ncbi:hypothetical protein F5Y15DRAFT_128985 [Xylariaceae sp. FL0016]|nr:hypothetical protein F5Y15DRAFT_128985 [Xylariaceae sp. FL0016]
MSSEDNQTLTPSIGLELEFLLFVKETGIETDIPTMFKSSRGKPISLPSNQLEDEQAREFAVQLLIDATIAQVTSQHTGDRVVRSAAQLRDPNAWHLRRARTWVVDKDGSVSLPPELASDPVIAQYTCMPVEINSPALFATDSSYAETHAVVKALRDEYWLFCPPTSGLHVHYGNGENYIPFHSLRRIGAFLFVADPVLVQLHPAHRRDNQYCRSNRNYSEIAHGKSATAAARESGTQEKEEAIEPFPATVSPSSVSPFENQWVFQRGELGGNIFNPTEFARGQPAEQLRIPGADTTQPVPLLRAFDELFKSVNAPTTAYLLNGPERLAYSFVAYLVTRYRVGPQMPPHAGSSSSGSTTESSSHEETSSSSSDSNAAGALSAQNNQPKRTIEFRQAAGSIEPDQVVAWAQVVVGLCMFASTANLRRLAHIAVDCAEAEIDATWYDVFDLLEEVGLTDQGKVLQNGIATSRQNYTPVRRIRFSAPAPPAMFSPITQPRSRTPFARPDDEMFLVRLLRSLTSYFSLLPSRN